MSANARGRDCSKSGNRERTGLSLTANALVFPQCSRTMEKILVHRMDRSKTSRNTGSQNILKERF